MHLFKEAIMYIYIYKIEEVRRLENWSLKFEIHIVYESMSMFKIKSKKKIIQI